MFKGTTILAINCNNKTVIGGDGQVSQNNTILKHCAVKIRFLYEKQILAGFAGTTADAFTLFEKFENYLQKYKGNLVRSAVELAKEWRTDKILRRLDALLIVGNKTQILLISGNGDVIEPDNNILAIGSGGTYARAAARALTENTQMDIKKVVEKSLHIAADICIYTNDNITIEELG